MPWNLSGTVAQAGDLAQVVGQKHNYYLFELETGATLHTHRGVINHDELIGKTWGSQIFSHMGSTFYLLQPALHDLIKETPRNSQIIYPKDIGFILVTMGIGPGITVIEAGTGSGALTSALAYAVGTTGQVISYEVREDMYYLAQKNISQLGLQKAVVLKLKDIKHGFDEIDANALFLDVPNPYDYVKQVRDALKPGGFFGSLIPTMNQVSKLLNALRNYDFAFIEVCEILCRYYRPEPERLRPNDRMVAHTGFLIFARPVLTATNENYLQMPGV